MTKFIFASLFALSVSSAFAQRGPRLPIPRLPIGARCSVSMIDNWHRVYRTYSGRRDLISGQCREPLRQCREDSRRRRNVRCVETNGRW
jgi:hypothetical protein